MKKFTTEKGIIVRINKAGTYDKVINIINNSGSRSALLAKGVRKPSSKKNHALELGNSVTVKKVEGYAVPILSDIKVDKNNNFWKEDYTKMTFLQFFCEVIDKFIYEESDNKELYDLFKSVIEYKKSDLIYLSAIFLIKLLYFNGDLPKLNESVENGEELISDTSESEGLYTTSLSVGYVAETSSTKKEKIDIRLFKTQRFIVKNTIENSLRINLTDLEKKEMLKIHLNWIEIVLERELKSKKILLSVI